MYRIKRLVQPDGDVSAYPGSQVDLCLEVELDSEKESSVLLLAILVDRALDHVAGRAVEAGGRGNSANGAAGGAGDLATAGSLASFAGSVGGVARGAGGLAVRLSVTKQWGRPRWLWWLRWLLTRQTY
jgi:hypothetical protein